MEWLQKSEISRTWIEFSENGIRYGCPSCLARVSDPEDPGDPGMILGEGHVEGPTTHEDQYCWASRCHGHLSDKVLLPARKKK